MPRRESRGKRCSVLLCLASEVRGTGIHWQATERELAQPATPGLAVCFKATLAHPHSPTLPFQVAFVVHRFLKAEKLLRTQFVQTCASPGVPVLLLTIPLLKLRDHPEATTLFADRTPSCAAVQMLIVLCLVVGAKSLTKAFLYCKNCKLSLPWTDCPAGEMR